MIRTIKTSIPTGCFDEDGNQSWVVLLNCGHEAKVWGTRRPKKGNHVRCRTCKGDAKQ